MNDKTNELKISRVEIDRDLCIGAATCLGIAPDAFELDEENKAVLKDAWKTVDAETIMMAAKSCPTLAIKVFDEDGKQLFPD